MIVSMSFRRKRILRLHGEHRVRAITSPVIPASPSGANLHKRLRAEGSGIDWRQACATRGPGKAELGLQVEYKTAR